MISTGLPGYTWVYIYPHYGSDSACDMTAEMVPPRAWPLAGVLSGVCIRQTPRWQALPELAEKWCKGSMLDNNM